MRQTFRLAALAALLLGVGAVVIPWGWERAFPTADAPDASPPAETLDSAAIESVNERLADVLSTLGVTPEAIESSHEEERQTGDHAWTFTRTTVDLPQQTSQDELDIAFARWPSNVEAFVTRADELTWSVRVYSGKYPVHQLVLRQPLDPDPAVDPATPPRLAVVLTGVGARSADVEQLINLPVPLTLALLPYRSHSLRYATDAARAAKEVAVHLVFDEPLTSRALSGMSIPPPLSVTMGQAAFANRLVDDLDAIPHTSGAVLASGTPTPGDYGSMEVLVDALQQRDLYLMDHEPVDRGVALQVAHRASVPASNATTVLGVDAESVLRLRNLAVRRGEAIAVAPVTEGTGDSLAQFVADRLDEGYQLVFASELVAGRDLAR